MEIIMVNVISNWRKKVDESGKELWNCFCKEKLDKDAIMRGVW